MENILKEAKGIVYQYYAANIGDIEFDDVFVVWFCKTLQNWKAIVSTKKGGFFELTHNGDEDETYLDYYIKKDNVTIVNV